MIASPIAQLTDSEILLWTILHNFEALALKQYEKNVLVLATPEKKELVELLASKVPTNKAMENTSLEEPVNNLLTSATNSDEIHTLIVQGILLEILGQTIYRTFKDSDAFTSATHALCLTGLTAQESIREETRKLILEKIGSGDKVYEVFVSISRPVIMNLDALGESLDQHFSEKFGISFSDLMGEFVAELISTCMDLGMDRRKVVGYLTSTLMGI